MAEFDGSDNSKESIDDEVTLMSKVFKQMMKKKGKFQHSSRRKVTRFKKKYKIQNNEIICFECKKLKHKPIPQLFLLKYPSNLLFVPIRSPLDQLENFTGGP